MAVRLVAHFHRRALKNLHPRRSLKFRGPRDLSPTIRFERAIIFLALPNGKRSAETNESGLRLFELFKRSRVGIAIDYAATDTTGLSRRFSFSLDRVRPRCSNVTCQLEFEKPRNVIESSGNAKISLPSYGLSLLVKITKGQEIFTLVAVLPSIFLLALIR